MFQYEPDNIYLPRLTTSLFTHGVLMDILKTSTEMFTQEINCTCGFG